MYAVAQGRVGKYGGPDCLPGIGRSRFWQPQVEFRDFKGTCKSRSRRGILKSNTFRLHVACMSSTVRIPGGQRL
jgi:hypothetical protein